MKTHRPEDSLKKRSLIKLISNIAAIPLFFILEAILPRVLGPVYYGNYNFAIMVYNQILALFDAGSPNCLATLLAKRQHEFGLVSFYARFCLFLFLLLGLLSILFIYTPASTFIMPDVPQWLILPAAIFAFSFWLSRLARTMNDALGITVQSEMTRIITNTGSATILAVLFFLGILSSNLLISLQCFFAAALAIALCTIMARVWPQRQWHLASASFKSYRTEFTVYCTPLIIVTIGSTIAILAERWMLQYFDGSAEQGYFSLAQKASAGCFLFVGAVTPLIMRELAVAHGTNNFMRMRDLLDNLAPFVYAVACWFSCFAAVEGHAVVQIFGGEQYLSAVFSVQLMTLFAIHQTYGQIATAVFYATENTKTLRNITLFNLVLGFVAAWLFLAPVQLGGFHLGSLGLVLKMVLVQCISVNILLWGCKKIIAFNYTRNLLHQMACPIVFLLIAWCTLQATQTAGLGTATNPMRFVVSGMLYTLLTGFAIYLIPSLAGLSRQRFTAYRQQGIAFLMRFFQSSDS